MVEAGKRGEMMRLKIMHFIVNYSIAETALMHL